MPRSRRTSIFGAHVLKLAAALTVAASVLVGCASDPSVQIPEGPWSTEFQSAYDSVDDPFVRGVLLDGAVTEQEYAEMVGRYSECMADVGITLKENPPSEGGFSYTFPASVSNDEAHAADTRCSEESGEYVIGALYHFVKRNPQHLDENRIVYDCLLAADVIDTSYTVDDFADDYVSQSFPFADDEASMERLGACDADPLGLLQ